MARYVDDYQGISGQFERPRGIDPNYRGPYRGMRMRSEPGQAAYGRHRLTHPEDFEGSGGFLGRYGRRGLYTGEFEAGYGGQGGGGGVRDLRRDRQALREFNANSPQLRGEQGYDRDARPRREPRFPHPRYDRPDYANRGIAGGYSEGWAWGPMRGAR